MEITIGLSPPTRGNLRRPHPFKTRQGSIPAHAGEPAPPRPPERYRWVYPRPRGGTKSLPLMSASDIGLSPPTRGNPPLSSASMMSARSIPAHAGEPGGDGRRRRVGEVYPRPRGGTPTAPAILRSSSGLSPPTRGNRARRNPRPVAIGSIPAHAGEPVHVALRLGLVGVYPRPRGGTLIDELTLRSVTGLSPPTRGNPAQDAPQLAYRGSIPAHAGEPHCGTVAFAASEVYPRPRGGTWVFFNRERPSKGLSPPTRGNLRQRRLAPSDEGSIPAHAGEPATRRAWAPPLRVYPRPRGGTGLGMNHPRWGVGLSPPTRGNPRGGLDQLRAVRSIPAHAGEPPTAGLRPSNRPVYPRPRGGTLDRPSSLPAPFGLSPPTRGNPGRTNRSWIFHRSIPAHAGEPRCAMTAPVSPPVYPRPRGGTTIKSATRLATRGLSPPTRGNRPQKLADHPALGSIPAHAGEPAACRTVKSWVGVYPRPRGGTALCVAAKLGPRGLSPPTRGNPYRG